MPIMVLLVAALAPGCASVGAGGRAEPEPRVEYVVSLPYPHTQMVDVSITLRGISGESIELALPAWRPGRYQILDLAGAVQEFKASDPAAGALRWRKVDKNTWRIDTGGAPEITATYRVYCNALEDRTRHVDDSHAFLSGASVFMFNPELRREPLIVRIEAPDAWHVRTGLAPDPTDPTGRALVAPDYDVLVDSPIEAGIHDLIEFEAGGKPHQIVAWTAGAPPEYDRETLRDDFRKIVEAELAIFGSLPYDRYVFLLHIAPGAGGGTEHLNSTIMQTSPEAFRSKDKYKDFLSLTSHEFFHTWNVKQFRPAGLHPYDYLRENYTELLWVAEGTTSYYDDLILVRTGHTRPDDYLKKSVADQISAHRKRVGSRIQSLEESSFDAWIKFNKPSPHAPNSTISFYSGGALASLALDMKIRGMTANRESLDGVVRALYERFPPSGPGFTTPDLLAVIREKTGEDFGPFFARHIATTDPIDFETILVTAGLQLQPDDPKGDEDPKSWLGFEASDSGGLANVTSVNSEGPAQRNGLMVGDTIAAADGLRFRAADLSNILKKTAPGQSIRLTIFRRDVMREIAITAAEVPPTKWKVRRVESPTDEQKAVYASWLGQGWPTDGPKAEAEK